MIMRMRSKRIFCAQLCVAALLACLQSDSVAADDKAVDRFGFAGCRQGSDGCLAGAKADALARLEACVRDRPCRYGDDCGPTFARDASADDVEKSAAQIERLKQRAEQRCQTLSHLASGLESKAEPETVAPEPKPVTRPTLAHSVLTPGTYYADLEWLPGTDGRRSDCASGRISLVVTRDFVVEWTLKGLRGQTAWKAAVDPETGQIKNSPGRIEVASVGRPGIDLPGEVEGRFSQFTLVSGCGRGKITVTNLAKAAQ